MLYAIKFKEKGDTRVISAVFEAESEVDAEKKINKFVQSQDFDIDKRTITWSGNSIPLHNDNNSPLIIYSNLDETT